MKLANSKLEAARLALTAGGGIDLIFSRQQKHHVDGQDLPSMRAQSTRAGFLGSYTQELNSALCKPIAVYQRLFESLTYVMTWRQYAALSIGQYPHMANFAQVCEIVALELDC